MQIHSFFPTSSLVPAWTGEVCLIGVNLLPFMKSGLGSNPGLSWHDEADPGIISTFVSVSIIRVSRTNKNALLLDFLAWVGGWYRV